MRFLLAALLSVVPAQPQATARDPKCAGAPDGIFGKLKGVYYGCLQEKEVRSDRPGAVPSDWIAAYDAKIREVDTAFKSARLKPVKSTTAAPAAPVLRAAVASPSPILTEEQANSIALDSAPADVVRSLGEPYMKISGDTERLTYRLTSGNLARFEFESGKLTRIRIVAGQ